MTGADAPPLSTVKIGIEGSRLGLSVTVESAQTQEVASPGTSSPAVSISRLVGAGLLMSISFYLVAVPALDLVRLDPIVQSYAVGCSYVDGVQCPIVEAREVLESFGLLDEAEGLWRPC